MAGWPVVLKPAVNAASGTARTIGEHRVVGRPFEGAERRGRPAIVGVSSRSKPLAHHRRCAESRLRVSIAAR